MADTELRDFLRGRGPNFVAVAQFLRPEVTDEGPRRAIALKVAKLLISIAGDLPDSPELTVATRHLLTAYDGYVRAALADLYVED